METSLKNLKKAIEDIAQKNPSGFTIDKKTLEPISKGYAVAISETQDSFGSEGLDKVIELSEKSFIDAFGGWLNDDKYYYDAVMIVDNIDDALLLGMRNKQKAIFNLATLEEISLG